MKKTEKMDQHQMMAEVLRVVSRGQHELIVEAVSRLLATHGAKLNKSESTSLLDLQAPILKCAFNDFFSACLEYIYYATQKSVCVHMHTHTHTHTHTCTCIHTHTHTHTHIQTFRHTYRQTDINT